MDTYRQNVADLSSRGQMLADMQGKALGQSMWDLNTESMRASIVALKNDRDFRYAVISDKDGAVIVEEGDPKILDNTLNIKYISSTAKLILADEVNILLIDGG